MTKELSLSPSRELGQFLTSLIEPEELLEGQSGGKAERCGRGKSEADGYIACYREIDTFGGKTFLNKEVEDALGIVRPTILPLEFEVPDTRSLAFAEVGSKEAK